MAIQVTLNGQNSVVIMIGTVVLSFYEGAHEDIAVNVLILRQHIVK